MITLRLKKAIRLRQDCRTSLQHRLSVRSPSCTSCQNLTWLLGAQSTGVTRRRSHFLKALHQWWKASGPKIVSLRTSSRRVEHWTPLVQISWTSRRSRCLSTSIEYRHQTSGQEREVKATQMSSPATARTKIMRITAVSLGVLAVFLIVAIWRLVSLNSSRWLCQGKTPGILNFNVAFRKDQHV